MIGRIFMAALAAGLLAGVFVSGAQMLKVVPLIHMAEPVSYTHLTLPTICSV